jgi:hypothetical protein
VLWRLAGALLVLVVLTAAGQARAEGITQAGDDLRDGWYPQQSSLTPQLVSGGTFGQLWSVTVEGQVYAQPLFDNGNLLVATEKTRSTSWKRPPGRCAGRNRSTWGRRGTRPTSAAQISRRASASPPLP